jgi:uncharacterized protein YecT (DUF1311 family)
MPDCADTATDIEGAICASVESRGLFSNIIRKFRDLRQELAGPRLAMLERTQRSWLTELLKSCSRTLFWSSESALVDKVADTLRADCVYLSGAERLEALNDVTREMLPPAPDLLGDGSERWDRKSWERAESEDPLAQPIILHRHPVFGFKKPFGHPPDFANPRDVLESMATSRDTIAKATHLTANWGSAGTRVLDQMMAGYRDCIGAMQNVAATRGAQFSPQYARAQWFICANGVAEAIRLTDPFERNQAKANQNAAGPSTQRGRKPPTQLPPSR